MKETLFLTGATAGIGEALAITLSQQYDIILSGRNTEKLEALKSKCSTENSVYILPLDLSDIDNLEKNILHFLSENQLAVQKFVHCAGFMKMVPLKLVSQDLMLETFKTNVFSANIIIKLLTNKKANNSALNNVVLISSNISNRGAKAMSTYGSSKAALDGLMRSLAVELAPKVRINSVLPGAVITEMTKSIFENEEVSQRMSAQYPLGIGLPNDIAEAVSFLLSEQSRWITGQQLTVDGGRSINITG
ncbi:short-chain dehydrogenase [Chryseobacterium sp. MYb7]|jgi:NAD(P)-dependent dehydrogenase (short-subunit alcohol dehydrogenase family)|uniref:SDR family NAD(P)-dependent oxidoreductase n=1 Tax=Chryseobacterium sp. MYb7 TaxID=1827290 RepID=UPI000CFE44AC|nr:SDR family oxidoreductase [Chryseobacterium sp. MYb7]PRB05608.1 short-chain dehydrogenase [Chryseobacterium sp. MYb7]